MTRRILVRGSLLKIALLALFASAGCMAQIPILQYPTFWQDGDVRTVAVAKFRNTSVYDHQAGNTISDRLAAALAANGTYERVYDRGDRRTRMARQDLTTLSAAGPARRTDVDAIIVGTVTSFDATSETDHEAEPLYATDADGSSYIVGYRPFTRNEAIVSVTAKMVDARTGETIHTSQPAQSHVWSEGSPPEYNMDACLAAAVNNVTDQLLDEFAIVDRILTVNKGDTLKITTGEYYDGEWQDQDTFTPSDETITVVVNLPPEADRSHFRLTIIRDETRTDLAAQEFVWSRDAPAGGMVFTFDLLEIAANGGGPGDYVLKFYAGEKPVIEKKFTIEPPQ